MFSHECGASGSLGHRVAISCESNFSKNLWRVVAIRKNVRNQDILGRWGGEELVVIVPDTNRPQASVSGKGAWAGSGGARDFLLADPSNSSGLTSFSDLGWFSRYEARC